MKQIRKVFTAILLLNAGVIYSQKVITIPPDALNCTNTARDAIYIKPPASGATIISPSGCSKVFNINENIIVPVDYQAEKGTTSNPRNIDQNLPVGTTAGTFNVSQTGAANYNIPITLPPGTAGMKPDLSISYNSQNGMGTLGMGWNLSGFSSISRTSKNKYYDGVISPVKLDITDVFAIDGDRKSVV